MSSTTVGVKVHFGVDREFLQRDVEMKYGYTSDDVEFSICGGFRGSIEM